MRLLPALGLVLLAGSWSGLNGQEQRNDRIYYPGSFNWRFLSRYPEAARLFNAFDYGHAVLYESLLTGGAGTTGRLDREYRYLTKDLLPRPPRFAIAEEAVMPRYARLAWRAKQIFDWAHVLHRQIYDVYADERLPQAVKDSLIERLTDHYLTREDYALTPVPKDMALMDGQYYSQAFRREYRRFNELIWAYHWLQVGLYEPFILGSSPAERKTLVQGATARFWTMVRDSTGGFPRVMPMTAVVAPRFSQAHPRAAIIFDNLHMMHDIISDILWSERVAPQDKRRVIYAALAEFQDSTRNVLTRLEWREMGHHMGGVEAMGGLPVPDAVSPSDPLEQRR